MRDEIYIPEYDPDGQLDLFPQYRLLRLAEVPEWAASVGHPLTHEEARKRARECSPGFLTVRGRYYLDREKFLAGCKR